MDVTLSPLRAAWRRLTGADDEPSGNSAIASMADQLTVRDQDWGNDLAADGMPASFGQYLSGETVEVVGMPRAGVRVSHREAFRTAAVWACMDAVASAMAASDWNVYEGVRGSGKGQAALATDQTQFLLNSRPNPEMTALSAKRAVMLGALGYGNGYAEIEWDGAGRFAGLWPIAPDRIEPRRDDENRRLFYRCTQTATGGFVDLDPVDVYHVRGASLIGCVGDDAVARAIRTISQNIALDEFSNAYYGNGLHLGGILTTKGKLGDEAFDTLKKRWNQRHQGPRNSFKTGILDGGVDYKPIESDAQKADLTNWKYQIIEEVCRWFRVPPHKIAHLLRATFTNIEQQGIEFVRDTLRPWSRECEQEAEYKLLSPRGPKRYIQIDLDWAAEGDYATRIRAFTMGIAGGVFCVNDVLRKLGENTIGAEGDVRMVQGAMIPLDRVGESYRVTGTPTDPQSPEDPQTEKPSGAMKPAAGTSAETAFDPWGGADVLEAWLTSVFARAKRRVLNRWRDGAKALTDGRSYLASQLEELAPLLDEDALAMAQERGVAAIARNGDAAREAGDFIRWMQERTET